MFDSGVEMLQLIIPELTNHVSEKHNAGMCRPLQISQLTES
jgi:hypothetical protein